MVNFNARINITVGGRRPNGVPAMIKPSVETMLEDLRVRGDRQHPFWAKVETQAAFRQAPSRKATLKPT